MKITMISISERGYGGKHIGFTSSFSSDSTESVFRCLVFHQTTLQKHFIIPINHYVVSLLNDDTEFP